MNNQERKRLEKLHNWRYKIALYCCLEKCVYCSERRECLDHVPPLSLIETINIEEYKEKGGKLLLYPACKQCNSYLYNFNQIDIYERLLYLEEKYTKKLKSVPSWTQDEINELGYNLQTLILSKQAKFDHYNNKLNGIRNNMVKYLTEN